MMKPPKDINYILAGYDIFLKSLKQMKGFLIRIYIQVHISDIEEIIKYSMLQWRLFVIKKLMILFMIGFYVYKSLSLYNSCLKTFHINNQTRLHFVNIWSKEVIENISYLINVNKIDGYLDASIIPTSVR